MAIVSLSSEQEPFQLFSFVGILGNTGNWGHPDVLTQTPLPLTWTPSFSYFLPRRLMRWPRSVYPCWRSSLQNLHLSDTQDKMFKDTPLPGAPHNQQYHSGTSGLRIKPWDLSLLPLLLIYSIIYLFISYVYGLNPPRVFVVCASRLPINYWMSSPALYLEEISGGRGQSGLCLSTHILDKESACDSLWAKYSPLHVFISKVLLEHSCAHWFKRCPWLLLNSNGRVEQLQ